MNTHIVRAPHTDRYKLEIPCSPADLKCAASVAAVRASQPYETTGTFIGGATVAEDTKQLVTAVTPLTVVVKEAGLYLVVWQSIWELAAFGDVQGTKAVLKNGVAAWSSTLAARIGPFHSYHAVAPLRLAVGDSLTFRITPVGGTITISSSVTITSLGP